VERGVRLTFFPSTFSVARVLQTFFFVLSGLFDICYPLRPSNWTFLQIPSNRCLRSLIRRVQHPLWRSGSFFWVVPPPFSIFFLFFFLVFNVPFQFPFTCLEMIPLGRFLAFGIDKPGCELSPPLFDPYDQQPLIGCLFWQDFFFLLEKT